MTEKLQQQTGTAPLLSDFAAQGAVYDGLMKTLHDGTFVHAYLISGMAGMGKRTLAKRIAQYLMCTGDADKPCGVCPGCVQVRDGNHPDVTVVRPEKSISVDAVREVIRLAGEHTYEGGRRVIIIEQADKMTPAAENCLLKTLEEPLAGTIFLLITDSPETMLPTIISRCRALKLHPWPDETVRRVLEAHDVDSVRREEAIRVSWGSIGKALSVAADEGYWQRRESVMRDFFALEERSGILRVSTQWKDRKEDADELLDDVEDMLRTLMFVRLGRLDASHAQSFPDKWRHMAERAPLESFAALTDAVWQARRMRQNQVTWQAVIEKLLLRLMEEGNRW